MQLLDSITVPHGDEERVIELYFGDLTDMSPEEAVDILVVSALPDNYELVPGSLVCALAEKGLSVEELSRDKAADLRATCACWISQELDSLQPGLQFKRIVCFEPLTRGAPPQVVGDIFRALIPFLDGKEIDSVAMPLLAAGVAKVPVSEIIPPLLDAAVRWMSLGIPLKRLKVVVWSEEQRSEVEACFGRLKEQSARASEVVSAPRPVYYDLFVSYAHADEHDISFMVDELHRLEPNLRLFVDHRELNPGMSWQQKLFEALDSSRRVLTAYSPAYIRSKVCMEEFNIAWARNRDTDEDVIFPVYLYGADLPTYMTLPDYVDCREGQRDRISAACESLAAALR